MKTGLGEMPDGETVSESGSEEMEMKGPRPDFRVVQPEYNSKLGKTLFKDVGAMWKGVSKSGNEFYTLKIGKLRLLVFHNEKR
ncbi:MAG: hypothetical protein QW568_03115 [Candidatus Anstonellaceae archaeon]